MVLASFSSLTEAKRSTEALAFDLDETPFLFLIGGGLKSQSLFFSKVFSRISTKNDFALINWLLRGDSNNAVAYQRLAT